MNGDLFGVPNSDVYLVISILLFFIVLELGAGYWNRSRRSSGDWIQEVLSYFALALIIKPLIVLVTLAIGSVILPSFASSLASWPFFIALLFYLLIDDVLQYWYHRSAHEYPFLWKLHRSHHQAEEMGFFVSYRNAALYYILMPNIWWLAVCTFSGIGTAVALGIVLKQLIIISSHSAVAYDKWFYKTKWAQPFIRVWERIFITPAFHHAHHGKSKIDGISDPNSNFGNMFSIWDQLFGTASFTTEFPLEYGLENDPKENWSVNYLYPLLKTDDPKSELSKGFQKTSTIKMEATVVELEKGKNYLWCTCGLSKNQPFCDSSHHGTKYKPQLFTATKTSKAKWCNCKLTKKGPFCDNSHFEFVDNKK